MAYIGRGTDKLSNIEKLDVITFDGSSSYTLQKNSVNFTPNSANSLQVSIDGVVQAGNFTVSGSTIDFGVAIPATSTNDFIFHYGTGLITTPADGTVDAGTLSTDAITGQTEDTTPADDDLILVYDTSATALKKVQKSNFAGGGITMADQWRLSANVTADATPISSNWERIDTYSPALVGTGMTESSGVFSFPETGIYLIIGNARFYAASGGDVSIDFILQITTDNSTYNQINLTQDGGNNNMGGGAFSSIIDVTDISNIKVRTTASSVTSGSLIQGNTSDSRTSLTFIRLGDT